MRADAVGAQVHLHRPGRRAGQRRQQLRQQGGGVVPAVQQHRHAVAGPLDRGQRLRQRPGVGAAADIEQIHRGEGLVHAHQHFALRWRGAQAQRHVQAARAVAIGHTAELTLRGGQRPLAQALDQRLVVAAKRDQVGDGADLQPMLDAKALQIGQPGHRAVVVHDFADHGGRRQPGHRCKITSRLGVAGAHQHAAVLGLQWKDMTRLDQRRRSGVSCHGCGHGARPVGGRDAGGDAGRGFDRDRERGAMDRAVARRHRRQLQSLAALAGQRQADQATAEAGHEVDRLGRDMVGRQHQVALVLTVFLVDQHHHATGRQLGDQLRNRGNGHPRIVGGGGIQARSAGPALVGALGQRQPPSISTWCGPKVAL